jgi:phosphoglycerate kinase
LAAIASGNSNSVIGGGDTIAAIANKPEKNRISHISTGGGATLQFIENGTLPGIEALSDIEI